MSCRCVDHGLLAFLLLSTVRSDLRVQGVIGPSFYGGDVKRVPVSTMLLATGSLAASWSSNLSKDSGCSRVQRPSQISRPQPTRPVN